MLAILTTHPIQYQVPVWQALAEDGRVPFEVWYLSNFGTRPDRDLEFGKTFQWDLPMLSEYTYRFLEGSTGVSPASFWDCRLKEQLRDRLVASRAKAIWIQGWQVLGYWQAVREARTAGVNVWLRAESNDLRPVPWWKRRIKRMAIGYLFSHIDRFFCIGSANCRLYRSFGVADYKLLSGPYAVDNERFARQAASIRGQRNALRLHWGIENDAFCVLFCGKFIAKKRPLDLVHAATVLKVSNRIPTIHLLFAGAGPLGAKLREACNVVFDAESMWADVARPAAAPPASFAGFLNQTEISRAYVAADCLVLPSDHGETWGLVINEALASGLPCIASNACGCAEDLVGPEWSFPLGDIAALAHRINDLHDLKEWHPKRPLPSVTETTMAIVRAYADLPAVPVCKLRH
jgi:glycosyltransferase involved in cell wall biosynthesis